MTFIFLDRDGTIIKDKHYQYDPEQIEFEDGALEGLRLLTSMDCNISIVSNQSGVARGYFDLRQMQHFNYCLNRLLELEEVVIQSWYCCPHRPSDNCICRKPSPYFLKRHMLRYPAADAYMVGDKISDLECGRNADISSCLVLTGNGLENMQEAKLKGYPIYSTLIDFSVKLFMSSS